MQGVEKDCTLTNNTVWKVDKDANEQSRVWRLKDKGRFTRLQPPFPANLENDILKELNKLESNGTHPAYIEGFENEAFRLYPEIDPEKISYFKEFVNYLKSEFGLKDKLNIADNLIKYSDGFGPDLVVVNDEKILLLPVIPKIYSAPKNWMEPSYCVVTSMIGPNMDLGVSPEKSWYFNTNYKPKDLATEGLTYFQAARAMVAWAAFENDSSGRFLTRICNLVMSGCRPLPYDK